jgi:hypothetical protein
MNERTAKVGFRNDRKAHHTIWIEPWANDYTLKPGEELELVVMGGDLHPMKLRNVQPYFYIVESEGATQVYCENTADFKVTQGGRELQNGHQRPPA